MKEVLAFNHEYAPHVSSKEIKDDVVSYLGEYRLGFQRFDYKLVFDGNLCDPYRFEKMRVKAQRAIEEREKINLPTHREESELLGIEVLEEDLKEAPDGATIVWASPPGPSREGYGDYGFIYLGKLARLSRIFSEIHMTAVRVESPTLYQLNFLRNEITGVFGNKLTEDEFLSSPIVTTNLTKEEAQDLVNDIFDPKFNEIKETLLWDCIRKAEPLIESYIKTKDKGVFHALENFVIAVKAGKNMPAGDVSEIVRNFSFLPPLVNGSCGVSAQSNRLFGSFPTDSSLSGNKKEWFVCPKCEYRADGPVGNRCPSCGITKEEFAKGGGQTC